MGIQVRVGAAEQADSDPSSWMDETLPLERRRELLERALRSLRTPPAGAAQPGHPATRSTDHPGSAPSDPTK
jgi:hypothetical protein